MDIITDFVPEKEIVPHFTYKELCCRRCLEEGRKYIAYDSKALLCLSSFREAIGSPVIIRSGTRCPVHNAEAGGHTQSYHLTGQAFDLSCSEASLSDVWLILEKLPLFRGMGFYPNSKDRFIHVDIREKPLRWIRNKGTYLYLI